MRVSCWCSTELGRARGENEIVEVILARHGNTFGPGDKVVWVGRAQDLPLVEIGEEQARWVAAALARTAFIPTAVYCSPLRRTRRFAEIVTADLRAPFSPVVDSRLDEIDYGDWTGLGNDDVAKRLDQGKALAAWDKNGVWPEGANWSPAREDMCRAVEEFLRRIAARHPAEARVLAVTSNGVLRFFGHLASPPRDDVGLGPFHMHTGYLAKLIYENGVWRIAFWDADPKTLDSHGAPTSGPADGLGGSEKDP